MSNKTIKTDLFEQFARIGKALARGNRLQILEFLAQGERHVEPLAQLTHQSIASTSQHLQQLRQAGLVSASKVGLYVFYRLAGDSIVRLLAALHAVGQEHLAEVDKLGRRYYNSKDRPEPLPPQKRMQRGNESLVTGPHLRPPQQYA